VPDADLAPVHHWQGHPQHPEHDELKVEEAHGGVGGVGGVQLLVPLRHGLLGPAAREGQVQHQACSQCTQRGAWLDLSSGMCGVVVRGGQLLQGLTMLLLLMLLLLFLLLLCGGQAGAGDVHDVSLVLHTMALR